MKKLFVVYGKLKKDIKSDDVSTLIGKEPLPTETKRY